MIKINEYFHKILKNNRDKRQIKFLIIRTFFLLNACKIRKLKIILQTNMIYIHQQFLQAVQRFCYSAISQGCTFKKDLGGVFYVTYIHQQFL